MTSIKVRDLMTTDVITLQPTDTVKKAAIKFAVDNISGAPVVDGRNHLLGVLTENDILDIILRYQMSLEKDYSDSVMLGYAMDVSQPDDTLKQISEEISNKTVAEIMTRTVLTTTPDAELIEVLKAMIGNGINRLPVIEKGIVIGIISRADIVFSLYKKKV